MPDSSPELCILFAYHKVDALTLHHLSLIEKHSHGFPVIPITDDVPEHLPNSVDVKDFPDLWPKTDAWRRCDTMLYRWFLNREITAKRYVFLEYDVLCNADLREIYAPVWDADIAGRDLFLPGTKRNMRFGKEVPDDWAWFDEIAQLPEADRPYAAGLVPLVGILFSHRGLDAVVNNVTDRDVFCELRMGTAARKAGLEIREFPSPLRDGLQWDVHILVPEGEGVFHSVKSLANPLPTKAELNLALNRPATQSSVSEWSRKSTPCEDAGGANNGVIDGEYGFHTDLELNPWWQVDLEFPCELSQIKLYNRAVAAERLSRFSIYISLDGMNWSCVFQKIDDAVWGDQTLEPFTAIFDSKPTARFVRIVLDGFNTLHFCECEILGVRI
jgi:F5/8 type C domain